MHCARQRQETAARGQERRLTVGCSACAFVGCLSPRHSLPHRVRHTHAHTELLRTVGDELRLSGLWDRSRSSSVADVVITVAWCSFVCVFRRWRLR